MAFKLRDTDKKVLCYLSKYVNHNLKEISEISGINYWGLYKIYERLRNAGVLREVIIPNFSYLGYEVFSAGYGNLTKKRVLEMLRLREEGEFKEYSSLLFYGIAESYRGFVFGLARNYTQVKKALIAAERTIRIRDILKSNEIEMVFLPLSIAHIPILFDYSRLLCRAAEIPNNEFLGMPESKPERNLTKRERMAMEIMLRNPRESLSSIAKKINATIQTASKIKRRLFEEGWLVRRFIPNLSALGYEVMVFAHWHTNPAKMEKLDSLKEGMKEGQVDMSNIVFLGYDVLEGVAIAVFHSLKESREIISFFEKLGEGVGVLAEDPKIMFLSLQEGIKIKDHVYDGIIENMPPRQAVLKPC